MITAFEVVSATNELKGEMLALLTPGDDLLHRGRMQRALDKVNKLSEELASRMLESDV